VTTSFPSADFRTIQGPFTPLSSPVPEPASTALLLAGLLGLIAQSRALKQHS